MMIKHKNIGVIFDFNGVIIDDYFFQKAVWDEISLILRHRMCTDEEMVNHLRGVPTQDILAWMSPKQLSSHQINDLITKKDEVFHQLSCTIPTGTLSLGFADFCDDLKKHSIPMTIATSARRESMILNFEQFQLDRWFELNNIVCNDGTHPGKPAPDAYLLSAQSLSLDPADCVVFEDAKNGIISAHSAGIGMIIAVGRKEKLSELSRLSGVSHSITNFREINVSKLLLLASKTKILNTSKFVCPKPGGGEIGL